MPTPVSHNNVCRVDGMQTDCLAVALAWSPQATRLHSIDDKAACRLSSTIASIAVMIAVPFSVFSIVVSISASLVGALPASSAEVDIVPQVEETSHLIPRQWDPTPVEPYTLPIVAELTVSELPAWTPLSTDTLTPTPTPSYTYAETHNDNKNTHTHQIIAGVVGALFIGIPIVGTIFFCMCRRCLGSGGNKGTDEKACEGNQSLMPERESSERTGDVRRGRRSSLR
ncbi:hypothetical protein DE146DRAFT_666972 [Phaeosphaeria sp. MPI-PUGE-AT-0046c]|nr:hypothetical protein DE146DRAFT_666972 [Phaeosphaeria sp. MPI-PUGE-AT-0046c]